MTRLMNRRHFGKFLAVSAAVSTMRYARAAPERGMPVASERVTVVAAFAAAAGEHPENVAVGADGTWWVSLHAAGTVWRREPDGAAASFALPVKPGVPGETRVNGLVATPASGAFVAVASAQPEAAGVWSVTAAGAWVRRAALATAAGANGMAADAAGALYIADDALGTIWRLPVEAETAEPWAVAPALARQPGPGRAPYGANGIKVRGEAVWVSNPSAATIVCIPVLADGSAGAPRTVFAGPAFAGIDDFAFATDGALYAADVLADAVVRVDPSGRVAPVLGPADGLANPTAVAFAAGGDLLVTNAAFYPGPDRPGASLLRAALGVAGEPLPLAPTRAVSTDRGVFGTNSVSPECP